MDLSVLRMTCDKILCGLSNDLISWLFQICDEVRDGTVRSTSPDYIDFVLGDSKWRHTCHRLGSLDIRS